MLHDEFKHIIDVVAATITAGAVMKILPPIATTLSIIWFAMQIGEKMHKWFKKHGVTKSEYNALVKASL